jgi:hypothetical protein
MTTQPQHLPKPFPLKLGYDQLYINEYIFEKHYEPDQWKEIRLRPGLTAEQVYQKLPSAETFEYAGYLTKTRIRFVKCFQTSADLLSPRSSCNFHSHPTDLPGTIPDVPSATDLTGFLFRKPLRSITVGKNLVWVFNKTPKTLPIIKKLTRWHEKNLVAVQTKLWKDPKFKGSIFDEYQNLLLTALGLDWPSRYKDVDDSFRKQWPRIITKTLKFDVTVYSRNQ